MRTRHAVTLIELVVVMSACTMILTTSAVLIHRVMHTQAQTLAFFDLERSAWRLSKQFRQDVHRAHAADTGESSLGKDAFLRLHFMDDQKVEYQYLDGTVLRRLSQNGSIVSREEFPFQSGVQVSIREEDLPSLLTLSIVATPGETPADTDKGPSISHRMSVSFQSVASLGRNVRFQQTTISQEVSQ